VKNLGKGKNGGVDAQESLPGIGECGHFYLKVACHLSEQSCWELCTSASIMCSTALIHRRRKPASATRIGTQSLGSISASVCSSRF